MKHLLIVRHGNTFRPGETPLRVGCRTDLPLVEEDRGLNAGRILKERGYIPHRIIAAPLQRTVGTARLILRAMNLDLPVETTPIFSEIDYGEDEGKPESDVVARLGKEAIERWDKEAIVPAGWQADPELLAKTWRDFAAAVKEDETVLVVSSNGVIRFAPAILPPDDYEQFVKTHSLKVTTGGVSVFCYENGFWSVAEWNLKPV